MKSHHRMTTQIMHKNGSAGGRFLFGSNILPKHIGGPGSRLPRFVECFLAWAFAIGCLGVALWHYQIDRYRTSGLRRRSYRRSSEDEGEVPHANQSNKYRRGNGSYNFHRQPCLPITTHSRREWSTVSESYEGLRIRYRQLLVLVYTSIYSTQMEGNPDEEEKKSIDENEHILAVRNVTSPEDQAQRREERISSMGENVAKWLYSNSVEITPLEALPSKHRKGTDFTTTTFSGIPNKTDDKSYQGKRHDSHEALIELIRTNDAARRLTSLLLGEDPIYTDKVVSSTGSPSNPVISQQIKTRNNKETWLNRLSSEEPGADALLRALRDSWPRLLQLPTYPSRKSSKETSRISVIVPAFREDARILASKIRGSLEYASEPHRIEIIIVHVLEYGPSHDTESQHKTEKHSYDNPSPFAKTLRKHLLSARSIEETGMSDGMAISRCPVVRVLEYSGGGGRGPCLNFGAKHATGDILAFLHGDTRLTTRGWDKALSEALREDDSSGRPRTTCCAFTFAIDTSPEALAVRRKKNCLSSGNRGKLQSCECSSNNNNDSDKSNHCYEQYYPPGLRAIEVTTNLRCRLFSMPYGDQCLSLPKAVFHYIGGYPDQCLMEDYELIRLLRRRSVASLARSGSLGPRSERIELLLDHKAVCSPRRWQNYGVLFVTYTNSYCVKRYSNGELTPDGLFCEYYGTSEPPMRSNGERSPWEAVL